MPRDSVNKKVPIVAGHTTLQSLTHQVKGLKGPVLRYRSKSPTDDRELTPQWVGPKDWIQRCQTKHLVKQGREYRNLERDIGDLVPAEYANDPAVAKAHEDVKSLIQDAASGSWLHRDELAKKLDALNQAVVALEKRKASTLQCVAQDNLNQVVGGAEAVGPQPPQELAHAIFQAPGKPGESATFKHTALQITVNKHVEPEPNQGGLKSSAQRMESRKAIPKLNKQDVASLRQLDPFIALGRSTYKLTEYKTRCELALKQPQVDARSLQVLHTVDALGKTPELDQKLGTGFHAKVKPGDPHPGLSQGLSVLLTLGSLVSQSTLRLGMPAEEMLAKANAYTNAKNEKAKDEYLLNFQGACKELCLRYRTTLDNVIHVAHHLVNASEHFPTVSAELKQLLEEHGRCLLAMVAAISVEDNDRAASLPYVPLYKLAQWGTQDPKAAMAALLEANRLATPPAKPAVPVVPPELPAQDLVVPNPAHLSPEELNEELARLMAEFDRVQEQAHDEGRDHLPGLLAELEALEQTPPKSEPETILPVPTALSMARPQMDAHAHRPGTRAKQDAKQLNMLGQQMRALEHARLDAQGEPPDSSKRAQLVQQAMAYMKAYNSTVKGLEARSQRLQSPQGQADVPFEDRPGLIKYAEGLTAMARALRDPQSAEARLFAFAKEVRATQRREAIESNPIRKITDATSDDLRSHFEDLANQQWSSTATSQRRRSEPPLASQDPELAQFNWDLEAATQLSPRSLRNARPLEGLPASEPPSRPDASTFDQVDDFLEKLTSNSSPLYDGVPAPTLTLPPSQERPAHTGPVGSPRTVRRWMHQSIDAIEQQRQRETKEKDKQRQAAYRQSLKATTKPEQPDSAKQGGKLRTLSRNLASNSRAAKRRLSTTPVGGGEG